MNIRNIKDKHTKQMIEKYGLAGVGVGYKLVNGIRSNEQSITFMVKKKLPKDKVPKGQMLPATLDGAKCDVIGIGEVTASAVYDKKVRAAMAGYSIGHEDTVSAGTLGCIVYKGSDRYILSNNHILANKNLADIGDSIYQPGRLDGGLVADTVAYLHSFVPLESEVNADCALAHITDDTLVSDVGIWGNVISDYADPELEDIVYKSGRTTGTTSAAVTIEHADVAVNYGGDLGVIVISDCFVTNCQSDSGDSGSLGRLDDTTACGLLFANSATITVFCYMSNIIPALNAVKGVGEADITFSPITVSTRNLYWVGGSGNISDAANHWAASSGGSPSIANLPTIVDNIIFDGNSHTSDYTVTSDLVFSCKNMTWGNPSSGKPTLAGDKNINILGNVSFVSGMGYAHTGILIFGASSGIQTLTTNSVLLKNVKICTTGTFKLIDNLTTSVFDYVSGTFNPNGKTVNINGTASINFYKAITFYNLTISGTLTDSKSIILYADITITNTLTITGFLPEGRPTVKSDTIGTQRTITAGAVSIDKCDFQDIIGAGASDWDISAGYTGDCGGNSGITFATPVTQTANGTTSFSWGTASRWTSRVPLPQDDVIVNNAFGPDSIISVNVVKLGKNIDFSGCSGSPTVKFGMTTYSYIYGSLDITGINTSNGAVTGTIVFAGRDSYTLTSGGGTFAQVLYFTHSDYTLQDELITSQSIRLGEEAVLDTNSQSVTCSYFSNETPATLTLGATLITLTSVEELGAVWVFDEDSTLTTAPDSTIKLNGDSGSVGAGFIFGSHEYGNLWITGDRTGDIFITGSNTFNDIRIDRDTGNKSIKFGESDTGYNTTTCNTFTCDVSGTNTLSIRNYSGTTKSTLVKSGGGVIDLDYIDIDYIEGSPIYTWFVGINSIDGGHNTNIYFIMSGDLDMINITVNSARVLTADEYIIGNEGDFGIETFTVTIPRYKTNVSLNDIEFTLIPAYILFEFADGSTRDFDLGSPSVQTSTLIYTLSLPIEACSKKGKIGVSVYVASALGDIHWSSLPNTQFKVKDTISPVDNFANTNPIIITNLQNGKLDKDFSGETTISSIEDTDIIPINKAGSIFKAAMTAIKAFLKTYFDTLYQTILVSGVNLKSVNDTSLLGSGNITIEGGGGGSETTQTIGTLIAGATEKLNPHANDKFGFADSETGNILKEFKYSRLLFLTKDNVLSTSNSDDIIEGAENLYYTTARAALKSDTSHNHSGTYEPLKGADDNFVTDDEKTVIGNTSGTNTGDQDLSGYETIAKSPNEVARVVVSGAVAAVDFSGLDLLGDGGIYMINVFGANTATKTLSMLCNDASGVIDTTTTNYYNYSTASSNNPYVGNVGQQNTAITIFLKMAAENTRPSANTSSTHRTNTTIGGSYTFNWTYYAATIPNLTKLRFILSDGSNMTTGLTFAIHKLGVL